MKLFNKSSAYLAATDVRDKIDDLANSNFTTLQDLAETSFIKSYDIEQTAQLRREITFENIICNLIEFDTSYTNIKSPEYDLNRLSKSASVLNYNVYLNSRNTERSSSSELSTIENDLTRNKTNIDFCLSTGVLNNLEKYAKKKKSKLVSKKNQMMKKMNRLNTDSEFFLAPLDHEFKDFVRQKKQIKDKLHDHWKIELNTHQKDKLLKINNDVFSSEQQWMTISSKNKQQQQDDDRDEDKIENSLIETFTANLDNSNNEKMDSYKVNTEVGTLIAQKLLKGEKIRVGRNGALIGVDNLERGHSFAKLFETFKIPSNGSILSWNDQVNQEDIKIIKPKVSISDSQKKTKPERNLIVKKLNEEDEFKPVIKKRITSTTTSPSVSAPSAVAGTNQSTLKLHNKSNEKNSFNIQSNNQQMAATNLQQVKTVVEIVGTNTVGHPFQQHLKSQKSEPSLAKIKNNDWSLDSTLVVKQQINTLNSSIINSNNTNNNINKTTSAKVAMNNLTEKNYLQIIDNLTSRYKSSVERTKSSNTNEPTTTTTTNHQTKKVNHKLNKKEHKDKVLEFINDLGLKSNEQVKRRKGTSSASFKSQSSNNFNLKSFDNNINNNNNHKLLAPINKNNSNSNNTKTDGSNSLKNSDNSNKNSQRSISPRTFSSFSQANTTKLNSSGKSVKASLTGVTNNNNNNNSSLTRSTSASKNLLPPKPSTKTLSCKRPKQTVRHIESTYFNIVKPLEPIFRQSEIESSFKQIIFDINKSDSNYLAPISPTASLLTR